MQHSIPNSRAKLLQPVITLGESASFDSLAHHRMPTPRHTGSFFVGIVQRFVYFVPANFSWPCKPTRPTQIPRRFGQRYARMEQELTAVALCGGVADRAEKKLRSVDEDGRPLQYIFLQGACGRNHSPPLEHGTESFDIYWDGGSVYNAVEARSG